MAKKKVKIIDMAREAGIAPTVVYGRIQLGWDVDRAVNTPVRPKRKATPAPAPSTFKLPAPKSSYLRVAQIAAVALVAAVVVVAMSEGF